MYNGREKKEFPYMPPRELIITRMPLMCLWHMGQEKNGGGGGIRGNKCTAGVYLTSPVGILAPSIRPYLLPGTNLEHSVVLKQYVNIVRLEACPLGNCNQPRYIARHCTLHEACHFQTRDQGLIGWNSMIRASKKSSTVNENYSTVNENYR